MCFNFLSQHAVRSAAPRRRAAVLVVNVVMVGMGEEVSFVRVVAIMV